MAEATLEERVATLEQLVAQLMGKTVQRYVKLHSLLEVIQ